MPNLILDDPHRLRALAAWYRDYANRANTPWVIEGRLQTADELEYHADMLEGSIRSGMPARHGDGQ